MTYNNSQVPLVIVSVNGLELCCTKGTTYQGPSQVQQTGLRNSIKSPTVSLRNICLGWNQMQYLPIPFRLRATPAYVRDIYSK